VKVWTGVGLGCGALVALVSVGVVLLGPGLAREVARVSGPIQRMKRSQAALDAMSDKAGWKRPARDALTAEQLERFFAVRRRVDAARRRTDLDLDRLPRRHVRTLEELKQVPTAIQGVSDLVGAEMDAFVEERMPPAEYHWIERLVYERWRGPLRRAGTYPLAARAAADEIEAVAARETDARVRARLQAAAAGLRRRTPAPPEGFDPQINALLLSRIEDVERWSLDVLATPFGDVPR
jgi:hypothetical protein